MRPTHSMDSAYLKKFFVGENVEDWSVVGGQIALTPYSESLDLIDIADLPSPICKWLWPRRTSLQSVISFGNKTRRQLSEPWWSWYRWIKDRLNSSLSLVYAFKETHNKFTLDRGGRVFSRHAPMIKLSATATEPEY